MNNVKQVIIMRKDLNMRKGKMISQGSHASCDVVIMQLTEIRGIRSQGKAFSDWLNSGKTKICVSVNSEEELLDLYKKAQDAGLLCSLVQDAGYTEFNGVPTYTAVAIGPANVDEIDPITKHLPLL